MSGGQWQKIALSRTFVRDSSLIILDEPNSSLDKNSVYKIISGILKEKDRHITIIITHSLDIVKQSDKVIFLKEGTVSDINTHQELLKSSSYRKLFNVK